MRQTSSRGSSASEPGSAGRLLIVPGDAAARERAQDCAGLLQAAGHLVRLAESFKRAQEDLASGDDEVAVLAVAEPGAAERKLAELLAPAREDIPIVVAGVAAGAASRSLIFAGAFVTVEDPAEAEEVERAVDQALRFARAVRREARFDPVESDLRRQIGAGESISQVHRLIARAAESTAPALIIGEAGSGKQLVARAIHAHAKSRRRDGPFVRCPLSALKPERMHEELHGTFARPGFLELAHGGTLFLDEIDLLPPSLQSGMVDLLSQGPAARVTQVEGTAATVDVRFVVGSPVDLEEMASRGRLRRDLCYHLSVLPIRMPPLRQRLSDLPLVATALADRFAARSGKSVMGLSPRAVALLQRYPWPGNLRELEEHVERAVRRARGPVIRAEDLAELAHMTAGRPDQPPTGVLDISIALDETLPLAEAGRRAAAAAEIAAIRRALKATGGNVTHAAKLLKVSRMHMQKRMKLYGLREGR